MREPKLIRKNSITEQAIQKQKKILIIAIFCVITLFVTSSYALLTNFDKTDNVITFTTGNLNMSVTNSGASLTLTELNGKLPESDETGLQNATPIVLTLTNTGTMNIMRYDVKLTSDATQTSTLDEKYIKYAISLDNGTTYSSPSLLTENDNIIYNDYNLAVNASKTIYLKLWIDESAGNYALNKEYYGSITVDLYQRLEPGSVTMMNAIAAKEVSAPLCETTVVEDGITYFSGTSECVNFNYVWYSGKLWRITAIYPDGTMKMITDDLMTAIGWGTDTSYATSWMREWLNQEFLPTLYNYEDIIVTDYKWNATTTSSSTSKPAEKTMITDPVGLLNAYEYYMSYKNTSYENGYLNIGYYWFLTPDDLGLKSVADDGWLYGEYPSTSTGVRPSVNLKSDIGFIGGDGSHNNPYVLNDASEEITNNTTLINTRVSGEYVKLENDMDTTRLFRIVGIENGTTKLVLNDYVKENDAVVKKSFSNDNMYGNGTTVDYLDYYLNNTYLGTLNSNMLEQGTYYLGYYNYDSYYNYKTTVCSSVDSAKSISDCINEGNVVDSKWIGYIGLLRVGEMFAIQPKDYTSENAGYMWLITPYDTSDVDVWCLLSDGHMWFEIPSYNENVARPSINLKSTIVVKSGSGTEWDPFVVGLPS